MFRLLKRSLHTVPKLSPQPISSLGPFSQQGFQTAWVDQQQHLTNELNVLIAGTADETRNPLSISLISQKDSKRQRVFDVSSQLFNNHFFFQQFNLNNEQTQPSRFLLNKINKDFGSLENLKSEIINKSQDLVGQGWIFLIEDFDKSLKVLTLNNSGSPLSNNKLNLDLNGPISEDNYLDLLQRNEINENFQLPLIAFNLWDVAYLHDFGINGKKQFIEKVWDSLDWTVINKRVFQF